MSQDFEKLTVYGKSFSGLTPDKEALLAEAGEKIKVGEHHLRVYPTPGHTDGQVSFNVEESPIYIVGDTIFEGGPGKTWSCEDFVTTLATLRNVVLAWPDDAVCHPGHGSSFQLGRIRAAIERFLAKDHGSFYGDATWEM